MGENIQVTGRINRVINKKDNRFIVITPNNNEYECMVVGFCPIMEGDIVNIKGFLINNKITITEPIYALVGEDRITAILCIQKGLRCTEKNAGFIYLSLYDTITRMEKIR